MQIPLQPSETPEMSAAELRQTMAQWTKPKERAAAFCREYAELCNRHGITVKGDYLWLSDTRPMVVRGQELNLYDPEGRLCIGPHSPDNLDFYLDLIEREKRTIPARLVEVGPDGRPAQSYSTS